MSERRSPIAHLRTVLIAAVCFVATCAAFPMPGPSTSKALKDPAGVQELDQWVQLLGGLGIEVTPEQLSEVVMWVATTSRSSRNTIVDPFRPFFRITATTQGWGLFAYPDTHPFTMVVEKAPRMGGYDIVYRSHDWDHQWMGGTLHYRRVRALYNPGLRTPRTYKPFATWLAGHIFDADPDATRVQLYFTRQRTPLPWQEPEPPEERKHHRQVRTRSSHESKR